MSASEGKNAASHPESMAKAEGKASHRGRMAKAEGKASHPERMAGNFYGRRKAKPLKPSQADAVERLLPDLIIDLEAPCPANPADLFGHAPKQIVLEIGFGGGEHMLNRARLHPDIGFIGCEPFINGMAKAVRGIDQDGLDNIRLYNEDATGLLDWLPAGTLSRIDLLYPDPWPKKRHWKRRFLNAGNLARFHRLLGSGGEFRFASDIDSYVNWTLQHVLNHGGFEWAASSARDWQEAWEDWYSTRYEQKAIREGRRPAYLIFRKK